MVVVGEACLGPRGGAPVLGMVVVGEALGVGQLARVSESARERPPWLRNQGLLFMINESWFMVYSFWFMVYGLCLVFSVEC